MYKYSGFIFLLLISGCSSTYTHNNFSNSGQNLHAGKSLIIATPSNGRYGDNTYQSSGEMTASAARAEFSKHSNNVTISESCSDIECLKKGESFVYYVVPEILQWEDRATEWSGLPDRIEIKITIYTGENFDVVASTTFTGKSKWATFGGDHPQDLLPTPMNTYISSLY